MIVNASFTIEEELFNQIKEIQKIQDRSFSSLCRIALRDYIDKYSQDKQMTTILGL